MFKAFVLSFFLLASSVWGQPRTQVESPIIPTGDFPVVDWAFVGNKPDLPSREEVDALRALIQSLQAQITALLPPPLYFGNVYLLAGEVDADFSLPSTWENGPTAVSDNSVLLFPIVPGENRQVKLAFATPEYGGELFDVVLEGGIQSSDRYQFLPLVGDPQQTITLDGVLCNYYVMQYDIQAVFGGHLTYTLTAVRP